MSVPMAFLEGPAAFDPGETSKVVNLSVTEGEDKPIKYPDMFAAADLMIRANAPPPTPEEITLDDD